MNIAEVRRRKRLLEAQMSVSFFCMHMTERILPISPDDIGEIATDGEAGIDAIYNLEGKRCNGTDRGLSIIRMSDGTTRKVLK